MKITSVQNELIKGLAKLHQKKHRDITNEVLIEGEHLVDEALKSNLVIKTLGINEGDILISERVAKKLSQTQSGSDIFAHIRKPKYEFVEGNRYLICDGVQDPGNLGTMIRTAYSFGFDMIIVSLDSVDPYNDKVIRSTQGSIFHIPVVQMELAQAYKILKALDVVLYATHVSDASTTLSDVNVENRIAIVVGSEGSGVSDLTLKEANHTLFIETSHFESLNVSVAAGIILHAIRKP